MQESIVFYDTETSRPDPTDPLNQIIQWAGIAVDFYSLEPLDSLEMKIQFDLKAANRQSLERNAYTPEAWENAWNRDDAFWEIDSFLQMHKGWLFTSKKGNQFPICQVAGHNIASFDNKLMLAWYNQMNIRFAPAAFWASGSIDTMETARGIAGLRSEHWFGGYSLEALASRYKIDPGQAHDALDDVRTNIEVFRALRNEIL